ncbi:heme-thiolate peroxidase [Phlebiopsis gigantea 11061_1 CR5-6]|uniref:Heme-thiolate peroxidase n=1 Tax=Phlebiopsis gigantea (strain 11061_1 CR5-6) TaxID=745531 RepID=A0A0C3S0D8_PHLG1|nr:heme-thiolate peroxidase [Phlebiopsis gigantea 11061_1 CR5-6]
MIQLSGDHHYEPQQSGDSRSPCPALNAMANHGYLPRDGRHIGWWQLVCGLREVYNLSFPLAAILTTVGMLFCGSWFHPGTLSLHELGLHNRLEHDCSLVHADALPNARFAPNHTDRTLLCRLLTIAPKSTVLAVQDFAWARIRRSKESGKSIDAIHREIAHGEAGLTLLTMGMPSSETDSSDESLTVPREFVKQWFGYDQFPEGWERPKKTITLRRAVAMSCIVKKEIRKIDPSFLKAT